MLACRTQHFHLFLFALLFSVLHMTGCGEEENPAPTVLSLTSNETRVDEGQQFAITARVDTPNRTGTDILVPLIYDGIPLNLIEGSEVTPLIQQDQEFISILLTVLDDPNQSGNRTLTISIDESRVPAGLTLGSTSVAITIQDK